MKIEQQAAMSFRGADVDPTRVGEMLGLQPDPEGHRKGDPVEIDGQTFPREEGFAYFTSTPAIARTASLEEHIGWLLDKLESCRPALHAWQERGWDIRLIMITATDQRSGGIHISPTTLRRMADLHLTAVWRMGLQSVARGL